MIVIEQRPGNPPIIPNSPPKYEFDQYTDRLTPKTLRSVSKIVKARLAQVPRIGELNHKELEMIALGQAAATGYKGDGFYSIARRQYDEKGLALAGFIEGNLGGLFHIGDSTVLWYPANVNDLADSLRSAEDIIRADSYRLPHTDKLQKPWKFFDLGCGDARSIILTSATGLPSVGIEAVDPLADLGDQNIAEAKEKGILRNTTTVLRGNFYDRKILDQAFTDRDNYRAVVFLSVGPTAAKVVKKIEPFLRPLDVILVYKHTLEEHPAFKDIKDKIWTRLIGGLTLTNTSIYRYMGDVPIPK